MAFDKGSIPSYEELEWNGLRGVAWGVFGEDDQLGTLNFIDESCVVRAARLVKSGKVFPLSLGQNFFDPPLSKGRKNATHEIFVSDVSLDDKYDDFFPQASSQWDAMRHYRHPKHGFYNGVSLDAILADEELFSISQMARRGIATRGILLDIGRARERWGRPIEYATDEVIDVDDLERCMKEEGLSPAQGDMLLIRTGWLTYWKTAGARKGVAEDEPARTPGLLNGPSVAAFLWNHRFAAIAADNRAIEATPGPGGRSLHVQTLTFLGMAVGELWDLDALAEDCARDGRYEFMLCSAPQDLPGGCGSPANALAIK
jgi:kynurenine formamidase